MSFHILHCLDFFFPYLGEMQSALMFLSVSFLEARGKTCVFYSHLSFAQVVASIIAFWCWLVHATIQYGDLDNRVPFYASNLLLHCS